MKMKLLLLAIACALPLLANASNIIRMNAPVSQTEAVTPPPLTPINLTLSGANFPLARVGEDFSFDLTPGLAWSGLTGGQSAPTVGWSVIGNLPAGLSLSPSGIISGFPTVHGTIPFEVSASGAGYSANRIYNLSIDPAPSVLINSATLPATTVNQSYTYDFKPLLQWTNLRNGETIPTLNWSSANSLPSGMSLSANGVFSGTPTQAGNISIDLIASGSGYSATKSYSFSVQPPADVISARYVKINITANNGDAYTAIQEIELRSTTDGPDITSPSTVTSHSSYFATNGNSSSKTVDNDFTNYNNNTWISASGASFPHVLTYDLGSEKEMKEIAIWSQPFGGYGATRAIKNFTVETSNDGVSWTVAKSFSNITGWVNGTPKVFQLK